MGAGDIIRQQRETLGLSLRELARLARVNNSDLSRVERGEMPPSAKLAAQVCHVLGLKLAEVYGLEGDATEEPPGEDMVQQIRAILIRGRWPPLAREGLVNLAKATRPASTGNIPGDDLHFNANKLFVTAAR